jgi:hypothetical protein
VRHENYVDQTGMTVVLRSVRNSYGFADGIAPTTTYSFAQASQKISYHDANGDAVSVTLSGRRNVAPGTAQAADEKKEAENPQVQSGLRAFFTDVQGFAGRIKKLQESISKAALGSEQEKALTAELEEEKSRFTELLGSDTFKHLDEVLTQIDQSLARGASGKDLAKYLRGEQALLGEDVLAVIQGGDTSKLLQVRAGIDGVKGIDLTSETASDDLVALSRQVFTALDGKKLEETEKKSVTAEGVKTLIEAPMLQTVKFDMPGDVSLALNTVTGKDAIKAIETHSLPDPRYALILLADTGEDEESPDKIREREKKRKLEKERYEAHQTLIDPDLTAPAPIENLPRGAETSAPEEKNDEPAAR